MTCCASGEFKPSEVSEVNMEMLEQQKVLEAVVEETNEEVEEEKAVGATEHKAEAVAEMPAEVIAEQVQAEFLTADPRKLVVTFEAKGTGKETELVFDTQPLPFNCKAESKGCCAGKSGRFAIKKVDQKKAEQYYDLKPGMLIKKLDGTELPIDLDWPEFQKLLATKTSQLKEKASAEEPRREAVVTASKEETAETAAAATKEETTEAPNAAEVATKEETAETAAVDTKEETVEAPNEEVTKEAPKETATEVVTADASKEATVRTATD